MTERRSDGATERRSDGATERRSDGATERRGDGATGRRSDGVTDWCPPLTIARMHNNTSPPGIIHGGGKLY